MSTIVVQMGAPAWTEEALHLACAMARNTGAEITLLNLIPVQHYGWLGTSLGDRLLSPDECDQMCGYQMIADSYGVDLVLRSMQYTAVTAALVAAVEHLDTNALFATIATSAIPFWRKYQIWDLQRQLARHHCTLYLLDQPVQMVAQPELSAVKQHV